MSHRYKANQAFKREKELITKEHQAFMDAMLLFNMLDDGVCPVCKTKGFIKDVRLGPHEMGTWCDICKTYVAGWSF